VVILCLNIVDHPHWVFSLLLLSLVPPHVVVLLWSSSWFCVDVRCLGMDRECTPLETEPLLPIIDCETDIGTIRVDDGFGYAQEWSYQNDGYSLISSCFYNHKVYHTPETRLHYDA
jgi:hypothetical protein